MPTAAPEITASLVWGGANENGWLNGIVRFSRTEDNSNPFTAYYSVGGTATSGTDYTALSGSVTFASSSSTADVTVYALRDNLIEGNETVILSISSDSSYTIGTAGGATVTVMDDPVVITLAKYADGKEGDTDGVFRFSRSGGDWTQTLTVNYSTGGTATGGSDYSSIGGTVTFAANELTADETIEVTDDSTAEATETVSMTVTSGTGYTIGSPSSASLNIFDNETPVVSVAMMDIAGEASDVGVFRFTRIGDLSDTISVDYSVGGTATSGTDYEALSGTVYLLADSTTGDVSVTPYADALVEGTETVTVMVTSGTGYTVGSPSTASMNIIDDPIITSVEKLSDAYESGSPQFRVTRAGGDMSQSVSVYYSLSGTAAVGYDYSIPYGYVTILSSNTSADFDFSCYNDSIVEPTETLIVTLTSGTGYTVGTTSTATAYIFDDETQEVSVEAIAEAQEGGSDGTFRFTRLGYLGSSLTVNYDIGGTATADEDYESLSGTVTFAANAATADVDVTTIADNLVEDDETVEVTVTSGTGYNIGTNNSDTLTITDDPPVITVEALADAYEGGDDGTFRFHRTGGDLTTTLTVDYTIDGSATAEDDYEELSGSVTFAADAATADVDVVAVDDETVEATETVTVYIDTGTEYAIGDPAYASVSILDNEKPEVTVSGQDTVETSTTGGFTFTRIGDLSEALDVNYSIDGTATPDTDYEALSGTVRFESGENTAFVSVNAFGDNTAEDDETVVATIDDGGDDYDIGTDGEATCTIHDQSLTVSVVRLADGTEGGSNGAFRFYRSGDISAALTISYSVGGTATGTSNSDYTALSGSVTFAADSDHTDVTVTVTNDSSVEPTETVTVTIDESDDYELGSSTDTLFIFDNDTTKVYWISSSSTDWSVAANWSINAVPTYYHDVYFDSAHSNIDCDNLGNGLSSLTFHALHVEGSYSGRITLDVPLSVGTFVIDSADAIIDQGGGDDLSVSDVMVWTDGWINGSSTAADLILDGCTALIAPTSAGTVHLGDSVQLMSGAICTMLAGDVELTQDDLEIEVNDGCGLVFEPGDGQRTGLVLSEGLTNGGDLHITSGGWAKVMNGASTQDGRIVNDGTVTLFAGTQLGLNGIAGNTVAYKQDSGTTKLHGGSTLVTKVGKEVIFFGGELATVTANGTSDAKIITPKMTFLGDDVAIGQSPYAHVFGMLSVVGAATWGKGTYHPVVEGEIDLGRADLWTSTGLFIIANPAILAPGAIDAEYGETLPSPGFRWYVVSGDSGINRPRFAPAIDFEVWSVDIINFRTPRDILKLSAV